MKAPINDMQTLFNVVRARDYALFFGIYNSGKK